jgi:hypothetical protein
MSLLALDPKHPVPDETLQASKPLDVQEVTSVLAPQTAACLFPEGYWYAYTRDSLAARDLLIDSLDAHGRLSVVEKQAVLDKFDLCQQADFDCYDNATAYL